MNADNNNSSVMDGDFSNRCRLNPNTQWMCNCCGKINTNNIYECNECHFSGRIFQDKLGNLIEINIFSKVFGNVLLSQMFSSEYSFKKEKLNGLIVYDFIDGKENGTFRKINSEELKILQTIWDDSYVWK